MPKTYGAHETQFILNLKEYFKRERANGGPLIPINALNERVANALQIGITTVCKMMKTHKIGVPVNSKTIKQARRVKFRIDETTISEIRNTIFDMVKNKEQINIKALNAKLHEKGSFKYSSQPLANVVRQIGFKITPDGLMEHPDIAMSRTNFLVKYTTMKFFDNSRPIIYLDESLWVIEKRSGNCIKQCSRHKTVRLMRNEGKRYVVFHAGNERGFLPNEPFIFSSKGYNPDNLPVVTDKSFINWFEEQILQKLDKPSVIVMNDDTYSSTLSQNYPNANWSKSDIENWLQERLIFYHNNLLKSQLLGIVNRNLPPKQYEVDELVKKYGHEVLRVPPFHVVFNPIEMVWAMIKKHFNENIEKETSGFDKVLSTFKDTLKNTGVAAWQDAVKSTDETIKYWWERENYFDQSDTVPVLIDIGQESDFEDSEFDSDSDSDYETSQNESTSTPKKPANKTDAPSKRAAPSTSAKSAKKVCLTNLSESSQK